MMSFPPETADSKTGSVAIFVKTLALSPVKTRLARGIGPERAEEFYQMSTRAIEAVVKSVVEGSPGLTPYWSVAEKVGIGHERWRGFLNIWQGEGDLGDRLACIYEKLLEKHRFVILIGADSPQMSPTLLTQAVQFLKEVSPREKRFILGEARDGGFYLFGGNAAIPREVWRSIPYSQSNTAQVLRNEMAPLAPIESLPPLIDVDTFEDLEMLRKEFEKSAVLLPEQAAVWKWVSGLMS